MKIPSLVSSRWLAQALLNFKNKPTIPLRVLDATWRHDGGSVKPRDNYQNKHIPGAVFFDIGECCDISSNYPRMIPDEKLFSEYAQYLGITNDSHVIAYEYNKKDNIFSSARAWWMFRCFGHNSVSVLNGGFAKWLEAGFPVEYGDEYHSDANEPFVARLNKELVRHYETMVENVESGGKLFPVVDCRGKDRFNGVGAEPQPGMSEGHIPYSSNIPYQECLDENQVLKDPERLRKVFEEKDVDLSQPFTTTCGSGMTACIVALAAHQCGCDDVSVYDGSWAEWGQRAPPEMVERA